MKTNPSITAFYARVSLKGNARMSLTLCLGFFLLSTVCNGQAQLIKDLNRAEERYFIEYDNLTSADTKVFSPAAELSCGIQMVRLWAPLDLKPWIASLTWPGLVLHYTSRERLTAVGSYGNQWVQVQQQRA